MVYVFVQLKLESYTKWKTFFDERSATRQESGSIEANLFRNSDDQNEVMILFEWDNIENARKYMESDTIRKYLQNVGAEIVNITYLDKQEATF